MAVFGFPCWYTVCGQVKTTVTHTCFCVSVLSVRFRLYKCVCHGRCKHTRSTLASVVAFVYVSESVVVVDGEGGWRGAVINEGMSPCYCMCCQREGPSARKPSKKKWGKERCTRQLLCPRALPRNVTQRREQLLGLRGPEGQGWHQRVHILYTLVHTPTFMNADTHRSLFPCGQKVEEHVTLNLHPLLFVCFGIFAAFQSKQRQRIYGGKKKKILNFDERGTRKPFWDQLNSCLLSRLRR